MQRFHLSLMAWLAFAVGIALSAPARPLYEPPPSYDPIDFRDTWWFGKTYEGADWIIVFHADGAVTNTDAGNVHKRSGTWKSTGNSIYMELHNKFYEFRGAVTDDRLDGDSSNTTGLRWKTNLRRIPPNSK